MRFIFSAPFRTNINLNSLRAVDSSDLITETIETAVRVVNKNLSAGFLWETPWSRLDDSELHYSELTEDRLPPSATPLLRLVIPGDVILSIQAQKNTSEHFKETEIRHCAIDYYDNTVGILCVDMTFKEIVDCEKFFALIDKWSTTFCSSIIKHIKPIEENIRTVLTSGNDVLKNSYFICPGKFNVFFDRNAINKENNASVEREEMLWVTRILISTSEEQDYDVLKTWTQAPNLLEIKAKIGNVSAAFCVGNSVVFGEPSKMEEYALKTSLSVSTYFYVLYDVLNQNLRLIFLKVSTTKKVETSVVSNVNRTRGHIEFIENEFSDVLMGLQGLRNDICRLLLKTWRYSELVNAVERKKNSVEKVIDFIIKEKQNRYGRIIESILVAIGGVAILDFSLNLFSFSSDPELGEDSIPGLIDAAKYLSVDATLYIMIVFLLFVLLLVMKKR